MNKMGGMLLKDGPVLREVYDELETRHSVNIICSAKKGHGLSDVTNFLNRLGITVTGDASVYVFATINGKKDADNIDKNGGEIIDHVWIDKDTY